MIKSIQFKSFPDNHYPYLPIFKQTEEMDFSHPITIFVGDNGSGKSTLLKAIASCSQSINVSSQPHDFAINQLAERISCTYDVQSKKGFFFSGEAFITYIHQLKKTKQELERDLERIEVEYRDKSAFARSQARMAPMGQLMQMNQMYHGELDKQSHGEGFLSFFKSRMHQKGLYLLDEPETPLSAINQYQLVVLISDLVKHGSQVILATHSPILMALEGAFIYSFDDEKITPIDYNEIDSVRFMKDFLNHKDIYLERLKERE